MVSTTCTSMFKACTRPDRTSCSEGHMGGGQNDARRCIFWSEWKQYGCSQCKIYGNFKTFFCGDIRERSSWEKGLSCISLVLVWILHEISALTILYPINVHRLSDRASERVANKWLSGKGERGCKASCWWWGIVVSPVRVTSKNRNVDDDVCIPEHLKNDNIA